MNEEKNKRGKIVRAAFRPLGRLGRGVGTAWKRGRIGLRNLARRAFRLRLDYVVIPISGPLPEREGPRRAFWQRWLPLGGQALSMERLQARLRRVADAGNVRGAVLILGSLDAGLATVQSLRRAIKRLRAAGKEVIVYTATLDLPHYYAAAAADRVIVPPTAQFELLGLRAEVLFLKDSLARAGITFDVVQISPYKTALDQFGRAGMSPEMRQQLDWLLDDRYEQITADLAADRKLSQDQVKELIDGAPYFAPEALAHGLVDLLAYDDELAQALAPEGTPEKAGRPLRARLATWDRARRLLLEKFRPASRKWIGVVSLEGGIIMGPSRRPPVNLPIPFFGGPMAGEETLLQTLRLAERQEGMAGLIFHVESRGGSALASDLIGRQLARIAQKIPVLAYMGNVAGSGGYYVSAPARHIMAQPATITGSIGVIAARVSTQVALEKLAARPVALERGRHAGLYLGRAPLSGEERGVLDAGIQQTYLQFKQVVAHGRGLALHELDTICLGRVWTGRQARERSLVDSHGDFVDAVAQLAKMAGLPAETHDIPVANIYPKGKGYLLPRPFEAPAGWAEWLSGAWLRQVLAGGPLLLMPFDLHWS